MKVELHKTNILEITDGYDDNGDEGVTSRHGTLNIRPAYQREFVYSDKQQKAVIKSVMRGLPLNVMYWVKNGDDDYEILDGQQRTISICEFVAGNYSVPDHNGNPQYFHSLEESDQEAILNYELLVYHCQGSSDDKLEWFQTVNVAGETLSNQELRNAVYTGPWLADAKRYFSMRACGAYNLGSDYMKGVAIRQDYLETVISWISEGSIEDYMSEHKNDVNAIALWTYFQQVISWVKITFPKYRKEMKGVAWGELYNQYGQEVFDSVELEEEVKRLMMDEDVKKKAGIYTYLISGDRKALSLRSFSDKQKREAHERQNGVCPSCEETFTMAEMQGDHIVPWSQGGATEANNLQMLCKRCNAVKSNKY